jgi:UDP-3-O-[3-hydroxymyristoyl] N-acetylglucosamine deacetylase
VQAFREVGIKTQRRRREYLRILKPVEVRDNDKFIAVYPGSGYSISYNIDFPRPIGKSGFELDLSQGAYGTQIAPARTFGFREDEQKLREMGLIRGVCEQNAIVLTSAGVQNGPLRFTDEFVRHKVLDLIGDLALAGHHILGRVVAERAGHAMHTSLVSRLLRDRGAWDLVTIDGQKRSSYPSARPSLVTA